MWLIKSYQKVTNKTDLSTDGSSDKWSYLRHFFKSQGKIFYHFHIPFFLIFET